MRTPDASAGGGAAAATATQRKLDLFQHVSIICDAYELGRESTRLNVFFAAWFLSDFSFHRQILYHSNKTKF